MSVGCGAGVSVVAEAVTRGRIAPRAKPPGVRFGALE